MHNFVSKRIVHLCRDKDDASDDLDDDDEDGVTSDQSTATDDNNTTATTGTRLDKAKQTDLVRRTMNVGVLSPGCRSTCENISSCGGSGSGGRRHSPGHGAPTSAAAGGRAESLASLLSLENVACSTSNNNNNNNTEINNFNSGVGAMSGLSKGISAGIHDHHHQQSGGGANLGVIGDGNGTRVCSSGTTNNNSSTKTISSVNSSQETRLGSHFSLDNSTTSHCLNNSSY